VFSPVVSTVYLIDDLSGRVASHAAGGVIGPDLAAELVADVRATTLRAAAAFPLGRVAVELISWEHVLDSLRLRLDGLACADLDVTLVVGRGGSRLAADLALWGTAFPERRDVAAARVLEDPNDAFYSPHRIAHRDRSDLSGSVGLGPGARALVIDDCVHTGTTLDEVVRISDVRPGRLITGLCNETTLGRLERIGWEVVYGVLLPGQTYPESYETDLYCVRDFVVEDAVRFADGSSTSFASGGNWCEVLYGAAGAAVASDWLRLADRLRAHDVSV
jgi:hypothetical protein